jgi:hypothetical protein
MLFIIGTYSDELVNALERSFVPGESRKLRQTVATLKTLLQIGCCNSQKAAGPRDNI